jgi:hypothetical protein
LLEETRDEGVNIVGEVISEFGRQMEPRLNTTIRERFECCRGFWRAMDRPVARIPGAFNRRLPLADPGFLSNVNFLTRSNQPNDHTPLRDALGELDKVVRLGFVVERALLLGGPDLLSIESALGFVEDQHMLWGNRSRSP